MKKKALIAMSGGVDSSVAAYLMKKAGYDCIGVTMRLHHEKEEYDTENSCCSSRDIEDARAVAEKLEIPYQVVNFEDDFKEKVIDPFIRSYQAGMTPNPCVECNRYLKFEHLFRKGQEWGCDLIVTGHYVRILEDEQGFHLYKGAEASKDQSYVLYSLSKDMLAHTRFPLGAYSKEEIRQIAQEQGFVNAEKEDSQDICFIPDGDYHAFIERTTGVRSQAGDFINQQGQIVGRHKGYYCYTIGQRRGLGISAPKPYYVTEIIPSENKVILGSNDDLFQTDLIAGDFNWIDLPGEDEIVKARIRYHQAEKECRITLLENGRVAVHFLQPQRAITRGQAVVVYRGDMVLGGGTIIERSLL